ncbi:MAG: hypothetical protein ACYTG0_31700 [Planctomycetota bacterium]|jgi:hypothetical protein
MLPERIERLKQEYTDKYVAVSGDRPELARFKKMVGQVKTVNMSGRALVEFDANNDHGWYDIELDYLKVVDKPEPKEPPKKTAKGAAAGAKKTPAEAKPKEENKEKLSPLELARMEKQAKQHAKEGAPGESTAEGPKSSGETPAAPPKKPGTGEDSTESEPK